ncbi:uncharacterized protein LOC141686473 [Apium graveolens]|uniref:uncharacterized protein LOC141686473 n=1 Tax=Apium graveolens TaxID=4045 RepID=UPI003D7A6638
MRKDVATFVRHCEVGQQQKQSHQSHAGLLQPLPLPNPATTITTSQPSLGRYFDGFHQRASDSKGVDTIKEAGVFGVFNTEVIRLHGFPASILSDRDKIFLSQFFARTILNAWFTPFKIVYGRDPPSITRSGRGKSVVDCMAEMLQESDAILDDLHFNLVRVGQLVDMIQLPPDSRLHPVFHVSQLKHGMGTLPVSPRIPNQMSPDLKMMVQPEELLAVRGKGNEQSGMLEVLLKWKDLPEYEAMWEDKEANDARFAAFHLKDKVLNWGQGNVIHCTKQPKILKSYTRRRKVD